MVDGAGSGSTEEDCIAVDRLCLASLCRILVSFSLLRPPQVVYFDSTKWGRRLSSAVSRFTRFRFVELDYSFVDIQDSDGGLSAARVWAIDVRDIAQNIVTDSLSQNPFIRRLAQRFDLQRLLIYLSKGIADELIPRQMQIKVLSWFQRQGAQKYGSHISLFVSSSPWRTEMDLYAMSCGVDLVWYRRGPALTFNLRGAFSGMGRKGWHALLRRIARSRKRREPSVDAPSSVLPTIAVNYSGKGLTQDLSRNSDLFWLPFADVDPGQVLVYFTRSDDPLDQQHYDTLKSGGVGCVALNDRARTRSDFPGWISDRSQKRRARLTGWVVLQMLLSLPARPRHLLWIVARSLEFVRQYAYWYTFFSDHNVRIHLNFVDWFGERVASDQVMHDLGGISISYQRSEESLPALRASAVHVHFGFSPRNAVDERLAGSSIRQFVSAGYINDHAFARVGSRGALLRSHLEKAGAKFVVCYFDEGSVDDKRLNVSHEHAAQHYRFLLTRLLEDEELGLILKPKKPSTIRTRLRGEVEKMLDSALATGRCILLEEGVVTTPELPCEPGYAADLCVGLLVGATATLEARLAGTPGVLIDRERILHHPFRGGSEGKIIFEDWQTLWSALEVYRLDPEANSDFGDWGTLLDEMDPFRDGRAAERIGEYVGALATGLMEGLHREEVMEFAAHQYTTRWGLDKVIEIDTREGAANQSETYPCAVDS